MEYTPQTFDWKFYLKNNKDLKNEGITTKGKAWWHWTFYGHKENRMHRCIVNDETNNDTVESCIINKKDNIKNIKFSIVMAYYNRKKQTLETLKGFQRMYAGKYNFEVIIVDDNSNDENKLDDKINNFTFQLKLLKITPEEKNNRINSCSVYNKGFNEAQGEIIIIQNPECIHMGNIFDYIEQNFSYDKYLSFPCYNSNNYEVNEYIYKNYENLNILNIENKTKHFNEDINVKNWPKWYQHPETYNKNLHFCTAIYKEYLQMIGGFSECFKDGVCYEDDDILFKIKNILKLDIVAVPINDNVGVVHLFHGRSAGVNISPNEKDIKKRGIWEKFSLNKSLFERNVRIDRKFPTPKIFHYYWDDFKKFSYLNLYSLKSAVHYHPDFIHIIWCPINPEKKITWDEYCNKEFNSDTYWKIYIKDIKKMPNVKIIYKNISNFTQINSNMSEIHKSDLFRYKILHKYGGIWSDLDIVYIKSITDIIDFDFDTINFLCKAIPHEVLYIPIGLLLSKRKKKLFKDIYENAIANFDKSKYQSLGSATFLKYFLNTSGNDLSVSKKNYLDQNNRYDSTKCNLKYTDDNKILYDNNEVNILLDEKTYMILNWYCIDDLFIKDKKQYNYSNTLGFHWFNGSNETKKYLTEIIEYKIPNKFNGAIFKEKYKFYKNYTKIVYFNIETDLWATFYKTKLKLYLKFFNNLQNIKIDLGKYCGNLKQKIIFDYTYDKLFIFEELSYNHLMLCYKFGNNENKKIIMDFLNNANYICFFCELFCNSKLQTIGNKYECKEFALLFFKNAEKVYLCNTKNINYLYENNIFNNIQYFPPLGYANSIFKPISNTNNYVNDIMFYGNILENFTYRHKIIKNIQKMCKNKYKFYIRDNLYEESEKNMLLEQTKIIIHIPSHENLHSFPWAKTSELILKKVFFIIEENEEMYIQGLDKVCIFYKRNDDSDLKNKIEYYLKNKDKRNIVVNKCYNHFKRNYNMDNLLNFN
tara:strand:+ start:1793 stop:4741 length:2949 start_codon:yes stop_codon:yes gene_type:complete